MSLDEQGCWGDRVTSTYTSAIQSPLLDLGLGVGVGVKGGQWLENLFKVMLMKLGTYEATLLISN